MWWAGLGALQHVASQFPWSTRNHACVPHEQFFYYFIQCNYDHCGTHLLSMHKSFSKLGLGGYWMVRYADTYITGWIVPVCPLISSVWPPRCSPPYQHLIATQWNGFSTGALCFSVLFHWVFLDPGYLLTYSGKYQHLTTAWMQPVRGKDYKMCQIYAAQV